MSKPDKKKLRPNWMDQGSQNSTLTYHQHLMKFAYKILDKCRPDVPSPFNEATKKTINALGADKIANTLAASMDDGVGGMPLMSQVYAAVAGAAQLYSEHGITPAPMKEESHMAQPETPVEKPGMPMAKFVMERCNAENSPFNDEQKKLIQEFGLENIAAVLANTDDGIGGMPLMSHVYGAVINAAQAAQGEQATQAAVANGEPHDEAGNSAETSAAPELSGPTNS